MLRYYLGRHRIVILIQVKNKALIMHLEKGFVGNIKLGYKDVNLLDLDITMIRFCRKNKKE